MDIANYIARYLLKNKYCYLHGLGNLELKRKGAEHNDGSLAAPEYEVVLTGTGSIDDAFANYIATHEQTSISKAANALRDFSTATRAELAAGKEVAIPGIGRFVSKGDKAGFVSEQQIQYTPPAIPVTRMASRDDSPKEPKWVPLELKEKPVINPDTTTTATEETYSAPTTGGPRIQWGKVVLAIVLVAGLIAAAIFGFRYLNQQSSNTEATTPDTAQQQSTATVVQDTAVAVQDTGSNNMANATAPVSNTTDGSYRILLNTYSTLSAAQRRVKTLTGNGNTVEIATTDSTQFFVLMPVQMSAADSTRMLDSLRRMYNPKGVSIYR